MVKSGFKIGYWTKFRENFKSSELIEKFEFILFPEPKIFLSSIPKVIPAPVSALKVPAKSRLPVLVSSSMSNVISTNWLLIFVLDQDYFPRKKVAIKSLRLHQGWQ